LTSREGFSALEGAASTGLAAVLTMLAVGILPFDRVTVGRRRVAFKRLYDSLRRSRAAGGRWRLGGRGRWRDDLALGDLVPLDDGVGAPLPGLQSHPLAAQVSPDGAHLFALTDAGIGYRRDVRPAAWARFACAVAGRRLTRQEWQDALPGRPYAPAC
jgi:hypothetical protein